MRKRIPIEPYGFSMVVTDSRETWNALRAEGIEPCTEDNADGAVGRGFNTECVLGVFDGEWHTLAHEAVHAAHLLLDYAGVVIEPQNDEAMAYLVGFIVKRTGAALRM